MISLLSNFQIFCQERISFGSRQGIMKRCPRWISLMILNLFYIEERNFFSIGHSQFRVLWMWWSWVFALDKKLAGQLAPSVFYHRRRPPFHSPVTTITTEIYFSKIWNIFVPLSKSICPNSQMYLSKWQAKEVGWTVGALCVPPSL